MKERRRSRFFGAATRDFGRVCPIRPASGEQTEITGGENGGEVFGGPHHPGYIRGGPPECGAVHSPMCILSTLDAARIRRNLRGNPLDAAGKVRPYANGRPVMNLDRSEEDHGRPCDSAPDDTVRSRQLSAGTSRPSEQSRHEGRRSGNHRGGRSRKPPGGQEKRSGGPRRDAAPAAVSTADLSVSL